MDKTGLDTARDVKLDYDFGKQVCVAPPPALLASRPSLLAETLQGHAAAAACVRQPQRPHPIQREDAPPHYWRLSERGLAEVYPAVGGQVLGLTREGKRGRTYSRL